MAEIHGFCDERFGEFEDAFHAIFDSGLDKGASLAVTLNGRPVVDLWGGSCDESETKAWAADTLVLVNSTSKVMVAIVVLMLVDRGLIDLDAPIADYWPEFGQNGKGTVTTRQVLSHQSGLPGFGQPMDAWVREWGRAIAILEAAPLWYEPGTISCYHPITFGFILGELAQRVTGQRFDQLFQSEVAEPLGGEFHFGVTKEHDLARLAHVWSPGTPEDLDPGMGGAVMGEFGPGGLRDPRNVGALIPAGMGLSNGRGLARIGSMMAMGGELDGRRYLSRAIIEEASSEQSYAEDQLMGWCRYGLGFGLHSDAFPAPTPTTFHWGGYGGSFLTMDMATGISCGFAPNRLLTHAEDPVRRVQLWRPLRRVSRALS